ncbi:MAG TPA: PorP/SprF family type IX secretion system membrane protein [Bacteroidales bacterium]|nr:PorP/SprF family type IX secretion system membrane protein [Bacteroidales bacterium]
MKQPGYKLVLLVFTILIFRSGYSQDIESGTPYNAPVLSNPAMTGSHPDGLMILSYRDFYSGNNYQIGSVFVSYDSYFEQVHGGFGAYLTENRLGKILNDLRSGVTYSYHLRATRELYINAGFMASVIHRSINRNEIIFPDQIDPLLGPVLASSEILDQGSRTVFDAGIGFLVRFRDYHAGISVNHLATPDMSRNGNREGRLGRRYSLHTSARYRLAQSPFYLNPLFYSSYQDGFLSYVGGISLEYKILAINNLIHCYSTGGINAIQTGLHLDLNRFGFSYNYLFSPLRPSGMIPGTLSNQITVYIRLNNVDKTTVINTINYPKL